jgi:hypothetical protein
MDLQCECGANYNGRPCADERKAAGAGTMGNNGKNNAQNNGNTFGCDRGKTGNDAARELLPDASPGALDRIRRANSCVTEHARRTAPVPMASVGPVCAYRPTDRVCSACAPPRVLSPHLLLKTLCFSGLASFCQFTDCRFRCGTERACRAAPVPMANTGLVCAYRPTDRVCSACAPPRVVSPRLLLKTLCFSVWRRFVNSPIAAFVSAGGDPSRTQGPAPPVRSLCHEPLSPSLIGAVPRRDKTRNIFSMRASRVMTGPRHPRLFGWLRRRVPAKIGGLLHYCLGGP